MPDLLQIGGATDEMTARVSEKFTIHKASDHADLSAWLADNGDKITHVQTNGHDGVKPDVMAALTNLKMISCYGVGYDNIDANEAVRRGIMVTHTPNVLNEEVATTAVLLMLACYRELLRDDAWVRSGAWEAKGNSPLTRSADDQTIGILGMGAKYKLAVSMVAESGDRNIILLDQFLDLLSTILEFFFEVTMAVAVK